jgi:hypothetical protein
MKEKHTLLNSALAYKNLWLIKSTMPSYRHSPHHLMVSQPHVIPSDDDDKIDKVQWYTPAHVCQNEQSNKCICFRKSTKPPKPILHETLKF